MVKTVKKRDTTIFFIDDERQGEFGMRFIPRDGDQKTTSYLKMQTSQCIEISTPSGYKNSVLITPMEFNKFIKDSITAGSDIEIHSNRYQIKIVCKGSIFTKEIVFGDTDYDEQYDWTDTYYAEQFAKISKISCMGNNIQVYTHERFPLLLKTQIGSIGDISVYIKSKFQIEKNKK
jgi:hypothetical protein